MSLTYTDRIKLYIDITKQLGLDDGLEAQFTELLKKSDITEVMAHPKHPEKSVHSVSPPSTDEVDYFAKWEDAFNNAVTALRTAVEEKYGETKTRELFSKIQDVIDGSLDQDNIKLPSAPSSAP